MLRIVDSFYETHGDASKLKYKSLETHAALLGVDAKEYDFGATMPLSGAFPS